MNLHLDTPDGTYDVIIEVESREFPRGRLCKTTRKQITVKVNMNEDNYTIKIDQLGKLKVNFLKMMYCKEGIIEMMAVKNVFDSQNILNIGNLF
ncbi:FAD-linked oxidase C-terminal domain-containing protein [Herbivorax sp. ANBcel31]|uniref:FAD-linked oxidase C-terminal domain-containing protein n=1 Tax=Herbivorax sp. ANBcel31 TaxID=3069754 RepID=UPI0027B6F043|nr:FAD-linked oxidase C-terminal domain-containing protein [Herbivorax sp. ANBcel31]MDQ2087738.1 FAD-linked oxidase C-terminal domain-containing protein [Herbivorax sp. ANBcel31]